MSVANEFLIYQSPLKKFECYPAIISRFKKRRKTASAVINFTQFGVFAKTKVSIMGVACSSRGELNAAVGCFLQFFTKVVNIKSHSVVMFHFVERGYWIFLNYDWTSYRVSRIGFVRSCDISLNIINPNFSL